MCRQIKVTYNNNNNNRIKYGAIDHIRKSDNHHNYEIMHLTATDTIISKIIIKKICSQFSEKNRSHII